MVDEDTDDGKNASTTNSNSTAGGSAQGTGGGLPVIYFARQGNGATTSICPPQPSVTNPALLVQAPKFTKDGVTLSLPPVTGETWTGLDLSHKGLHNLSKNIAYYRHLTYLNLSHNSLTSLPVQLFTHLPMLAYLDANFNHLTSLPPQVGNLVNLENLLLYQNKLVELPPELGRCFRLKSLNVEGNPIASPPINILQGGTDTIISYLRDRMPMSAPPVERRWISFEKDVDKNTRADPYRMRVFCYNVLAEVYAIPDRHCYCPSWAIEWDYRKKLVVQEISKHNPDIMCLQEVESKQYREFFEPELGKLGYSGVFRPKSRAKTMDEWSSVDGCATFYKRDKYKVVEEVLIEYQSLALQRHAKMKGDHSGLERLMTKDNIALALVLQLTMAPPISVAKPPANKMRGGRPTIVKMAPRILVANTHIHWDPSLKDVKLMQTQLLMEELMTISHRYKESPLPIIVGGDFNSMPDSGVYELLEKGNVTGKHPDLGNYYYGTYSSEGLQHNIMLASAYKAIGEPTFTNYTGDYIGVLDYVWYTTDTLKVCGLLQPLDYALLSSPLPNPHFPSDHISLLAEFELKHRG